MHTFDLAERDVEGSGRGGGGGGGGVRTHIKKETGTVD